MTNSNYQDIIDAINQQEPSFLELAKDGGYICPFCNNGAGKDGTGIHRNKNITNKNSYHCFTCTDKGEHDTLDLFKEHFNLSYDNFKELLKDAADYYNIPCEFDTGYKSKIEVQRQETPLTRRQDNTPKEPEKVYKDLTEEYLLYNKMLLNPCTEDERKDAQIVMNYLTKVRKISKEVIEKYKIGMRKITYFNGENGEGKVLYATIPTSKIGYCMRNTDTKAPKERRFKKEGTTKEMYLKGLLLQDTFNPLFICESEIDALSVITCGYDAMAICGVQGKGKLINFFDENIDKIKRPLLILLDNDTAGKTAAGELYQYLRQYKDEVFNITEWLEVYKDINEYLCEEKEQLICLLEKAFNYPIDEYYRENSSINRRKEFEEFLTTTKGAPIETKFTELDKALDGGLYAGLYIIGAGSSTGKTTFVHQIAENIAKQDTDIIYCSLEMDTTELIAKSISRNMYNHLLANGESSCHAKTTRSLLNGSCANFFNGTSLNEYEEKEKTYLNKARSEYFNSYGKHMTVIEGVANFGVNSIKKAIERHIKFTHKKPVVIVDYLQMLADEITKSVSDKQKTDFNVVELKRISRDNGIPIVIISSFNRENYDEPLTMKAFKESGAIEYTADIAIGYEEVLVKQNEDKLEKDMHLRILKNRHGAKNKSIYLKYYVCFNYLHEQNKPNALEVIDENKRIKELYKAKKDREKLREMMKALDEVEEDDSAISSYINSISSNGYKRY